MMLAGYSQAKLDYSAKPKHEAKGYSVKGLSASSARFLYELQQAKAQNRVDMLQGSVSAMLMLAEGRTSEELATYGVKLNQLAGGIYTATIPVDRFEALAASGLCKTIDMGERMELHLDNARENLGIDQIHTGMYLPHGYDGTGVVVGVIDIGFEFCHPSFYNAEGNFRVKRAWNQRDTLGVHPAGYSYGTEYTTEAEMMAAETDYTRHTHGSHVAGIAAGCGAPTGHGTAYEGIASNADLVFVGTTLKEAAILDAITYIHQYAQSVNKPCVINMSFGSNMGPHDGTGNLDHFITSYMEQHNEGLVLVASAGNSGGSNHHIEKQFYPEDNMLTSYLKLESYLNLSAGVDIWSEENFSVALTLVDAETGTQEDFTGFFTTGTENDTLIVTTLVGHENEPLECKFTLSPQSTYNGRYHSQIELSSDGEAPGASHVILTIQCDNPSNVHVWCDHLEFFHTPEVEGTVAGDDHYTVEGFGASTDVVISVGSYVSKNYYTSYDGATFMGNATFGDISSFSSIGPTMDGRVKPDITAPGEVIVAPYNRYATAGTITTLDTIVWNGNVEKYGRMQGTSMSCPMVTGIVALWLQANPSLSVNEVRAILHQTARNDQYTGAVVSNPSNRWGHGKVNAYGGLPADTTLYLVTTCPEVGGTGTVSGGGVVPLGEHVLTAIPSANYSFVAWTDGNADNPRTVSITCDTMFMAVFSPVSYDDCDTIVDFPWTATFDEDFTCWKLIDADGDGSCWRKLPASVMSTATGAGVSTLDNWLVSPVVEVNQPLTVKVTTRALHGGTGSERCSLLLSTLGSETTDFTTVLTTYVYTMGNMDTIALSGVLDDYQGQTVRLAVRHHDCSGVLASLFLHDFEILTTPASVSAYSETTNYNVVVDGSQINISDAKDNALRIFDMTGRMVVSSNVANGTYQMPSSGVYIILVNGYEPRKVMVVR